MNRNIVVIGASAGGFDAIKKLIYALPANLNISIFIVWHIAPNVTGVLPQLLNKQSKYPAANAVDNERIETGRIYIAPPDHHMVLLENAIRITRGPKENRFRPAVDPLFRSAAYYHGARVIGIILSGALDDGSAGLRTIKEFGGIAVVQDPNDSEVPSMPQNAIRQAHPDNVVPVSEMPALLEQLVNDPITEINEPAVEDREKTKMEIQFALQNEIYIDDLVKFGKLTKFTCPDCHGVLTALKEGENMRFRCHTGHAFSADTLLYSISDNIEENLWSSIKSMHESVFLLNHIGDQYAENNNPQVAARFFKKATEANARAMNLREMISGNEQLTIDDLNNDTNDLSAAADSAK